MDASERQAEEAELRRAVLRGEVHAWRVLYDGSFDVLAAWVRRRVEPGAVDDVLQETWLTAVRRLRDFDPVRGSFLAWLCGIAMRVGAASSRQAARRPPSLAGEPAAARLGGVSLAPALAALPESYREVLLAKYGDGRQVADIAAERGVTPKAVESMLTRARTAFREAWDRTKELP